MKSIRVKYVSRMPPKVNCGRIAKKIAEKDIREVIFRGMDATKNYIRVISTYRI